MPLGKNNIFKLHNINKNNFFIDGNKNSLENYFPFAVTAFNCLLMTPDGDLWFWWVIWILKIGNKIFFMVDIDESSQGVTRVHAAPGKN